MPDKDKADAKEKQVGEEANQVAPGQNPPVQEPEDGVVKDEDTEPVDEDGVPVEGDVPSDK